MEIPPTLQADIQSGAWAGWPEPLKRTLLARLRSYRPPMPVIDWVLRHRAMLVPNRPTDFVSHAYLLDLYRATEEWVIVYKASQLGASEYLISYAFYAADQLKATVLYVFPTDTHVSDFSRARIGPAIEASPYLASIVVPGRSRGADLVGLKRVGDRFVYFRGAKVSPEGYAAQLKSVDADVLLLDEIDEMDSRAPAIAEKRLGHSRLGVRRSVSTPTYRGRGIHALWETSDQRQWFVRCPHCGERQAMGMSQVVREFDNLGRPKVWNGMAEGRAWVSCLRCGEELDRLGAGEWVAAHPGRMPVGFHLTKLFSPLADLTSMVLKLYSVDETERKETFNQDWGLPYDPRGGRLTDQILDLARREYGHGPVAGEKCFMGVDVGDLLHVVIRGPENRQSHESPQRYAGAVSDFSEVAALMGLYNVGVCVVDALPETRAARQFQQGQRAGRVWLAYYVIQKTGSRREDAIQPNADEGTVNLDRTRCLDEMMARVMAATVPDADVVADHVFTLPAHARSVEEYYDHLKALLRVLEEHAGNRVAVYVNEGADHFAHAENYCRVAMALPAPTPLPAQAGLEKESGWD
jgi:hypothetical protein